MQILAFFVTWAILGAGITFWLNDSGPDMLLAVIAGFIGGFIVNVLAWIIFRSGFPPMM
jgi:uncharacterized membrane protein YeiH